MTGAAVFLLTVLMQARSMKQKRSHRLPQSLPLVQLQLLLPIINALEARGVDPETVLDSVGLTLSAVKQPGTTVHVMVVHQFVENCAQATDDKHFCAEVGASLDPTGWPMIQKAMAEANSLGDFLNIYVTTASQVSSSVIPFLEVRGDTAIFGETRRFKPLIVPAQNDGFMISLKLSLITRAVRDKLNSQKVLLVVCDPSVLPSDMKRFQILKGDDMGVKIQFPSGWLRAPLAKPDMADQSFDAPYHLSEANFLSSFQSILRQYISHGGLSVEDAARLVHMNKRTLARRLAAFGTSASREISAMKVEYAKKTLLESDKSIEEVSADLGYSDPSNFSRAFAKATGLTPSDCRARERELMEE